MIILVHNNNKPVTIFDASSEFAIDFDAEKELGSILYELAKVYPKELLIWVHQDYKEQIDFDAINNIFHHKLIMASFTVSGKYVIPEQIGYVEQKPYTNVSKHVYFPTWLMSSDIGGIYAETFNNIKLQHLDEKDFNLLLCSLAKQAMPKGLFCYSNPNLLKKSGKLKVKEVQVSTFQLFKFVKQHYKAIWIVNLLLCFLFFEKKLHLMSFLRSLFFKKLHAEVDFSKINVLSTKNKKIEKEVDVIIPTLGRKECLYDVLKDLSNQTWLPENVIIVEQNSIENSVSELDYLNNETWPFIIKHYFINQTGACNARNLALSHVTSEWVFLADDDIRFDSKLIEKTFQNIKKYRTGAFVFLCLQPGETQTYFITAQTDIFGSGTSFVKSSLLEKVNFDTAFEYGYGEDSDFGMQIRKTGNDVVFFPDIKITHLKAPMGGFRTKTKQLWEDDKVQPKPSPTIMLFVKKHYNEYQIKGYKYNVFVKFYRKQPIINPFKYLETMQDQWQKSMYWSEQLKVK
ncbi:glycosyltransferase family A protein [Mariniflexile litorale]|uniref:Glycosyltransferase family A protein n=1 Tax=Mariniflexile litorale TaxID=3045158 RepID=A0AAU7EB12_9FLAO|nr:glycosyltransferase family A protein [Mariniflexile sp. KMM 9835]MDQ8212204.1 glycosyltransferase family A protein [Mariniflexile sp. KMM 9835]